MSWSASVPVGQARRRQVGARGRGRGRVGASSRPGATARRNTRRHARERGQPIARARLRTVGPLTISVRPLCEDRSDGRRARRRPDRCLRRASSSRPSPGPSSTPGSASTADTSASSAGRRTSSRGSWAARCGRGRAVRTHLGGPRRTGARTPPGRRRRSPVDGDENLTSLDGRCRANTDGGGRRRRECPAASLAA